MNGAAPITWPTIDGWERHSKCALDTDELRVIGAMDRAFRFPDEEQKAAPQDAAVVPRRSWPTKPKEG